MYADLCNVANIKIAVPVFICLDLKNVQYLISWILAKEEKCFVAGPFIKSIWYLSGLVACGGKRVRVKVRGVGVGVGVRLRKEVSDKGKVGVGVNCGVEWEWEWAWGRVGMRVGVRDLGVRVGAKVCVRESGSESGREENWEWEWAWWRLGARVGVRVGVRERERERAWGILGVRVGLRLRKIVGLKDKPNK